MNFASGRKVGLLKIGPVIEIVFSPQFHHFAPGGFAITMACGLSPGTVIL
jgi:hypothetical protein